MQKRRLKFIIPTLKDVRNHNLYKIGNISKLCGLSFSSKYPLGKEAALSTAMNWLCRAQDDTRCGGIASGYSFRNGWKSAYPETMGYIIETCYDYVAFSGDESCRIRIHEMDVL